jgi:uncharacterized protein YndB with AHSA1/START domain
MTTTTAVRLQRTIPAPPERVYRAWLEPELMRRWMFAGDRTVTRVEVDERQGGRWATWQAGPDGETAGGFECELLELEPPHRLVWRWGFAGPDRVAGPVFDSLLTVTLRGTGDGQTELTLVHERLEALAEAMPDVAAAVSTGWQEALDHLEVALG